MRAFGLVLYLAAAGVVGAVADPDWKTFALVGSGYLACFGLSLLLRTDYGGAR